MSKTNPQPPEKHYAYIGFRPGPLGPRIRQLAADSSRDISDILRESVNMGLPILEERRKKELQCLKRR